MEEATHIAIVLVGLESAYLLFQCSSSHLPDFAHLSESFKPAIIFIVAYAGCIATIFMNVKQIRFFQSKIIRNLIKYLHAADGAVALLMGIAICYQSNILFIIGILCITKLFLLHLLSRMVTGVATHSMAAVALQTTKTFIHHTASFYFISDPTTALLTGVWRCISMNGHAVLTLRGTLPEKTYERLMWIITHARNAAMITILILCLYSFQIRRGFGKSIDYFIEACLTRSKKIMFI